MDHPNESFQAEYSELIEKERQILWWAKDNSTCNEYLHNKNNQNNRSISVIKNVNKKTTSAQPQH